MFSISRLIIALRWYSSVSATPGVTIRTVDASGIVKPRFALPVVEGVGSGSGIVLGPVSGVGDLCLCNSLWACLSDRWLCAGLGKSSLPWSTTKGSGQFDHLVG